MCIRDSSWQWAYRERFEKAGITALLGSGFDPGVTSVFSAYALKHEFDEINYIDILDCNGGDHGYPFATNFNPEINIREVSANGSYWEDGHWVETEPMEIKREYTFEGVGKKDMYLLHHEEIESLALNIPGIKRIRFFMTFGQSYLTHLKCLENVGMTSIEPILYEGKEIIPLQFLKAVLPDPSSLGPRTVGKTNIGCIFRGKKDGKDKTYYLYNICDHQECYKEVGSQAVAYTTGVPAMILSLIHIFMVYGDGAFKDPVGKIWELADPVVSPAYTPGLEGTPNEVKLKYLADNNFADLSGDALKEAISDYIRHKDEDLKGQMVSQGKMCIRDRNHRLPALQGRHPPDLPVRCSCFEGLRRPMPEPQTNLRRSVLQAAGGFFQRRKIKSGAGCQKAGAGCQK